QRTSRRKRGPGRRERLTRSDVDFNAHQFAYDVDVVSMLETLFVGHADEGSVTRIVVLNHNLAVLPRESDMLSRGVSVVREVHIAPLSTNQNVVVHRTE